VLILLAIGPCWPSLENLTLFRACLVKVRVGTVSYALSYEKAVSDRPFRCSVDPFAIVPAHPKRPGKTSYPLLTRCFRRLLLRAKERLPLAAFAPRPSSLVFRLLPFQKVPIERTVVPHPQSPALDREEEGGQRPQPTAAIIDSQSVKTTEESAHPSGYDTHKNVKGRKRRLLVDSLGLLLSVYVSPADVQDRGGALSLLAGLKALLPRLKKIWADGAYTGETLAGWCKEQGEWELEIVERSSSADTEGFVVPPRRWIVERTLEWLMRNRRLSKVYERLMQTSETFIEVAMIRLILTRLGKRA
jgi:transposase